jgi:integrase
MGRRGTGKLTALFAARHKKRGLYNDGGGLYLQITGTDARSWIFRYWVAERGHCRDMGLGSLHVVSLEKARDLAGEYRRMLRQGVDPLEAMRTTKAQRRLEAARTITFSECARRYIEAHRAEWKDTKHRQQWQNTIAQHAEPLVGNVPVQDIDTAAIHKVLAPIWTTTPETASRLRGRIEAILDWARVLGYRTGENPARWRGHLDHLLPKLSRVRKIAHHPAMPYGEIPEFMTTLRVRESPAARALEFCILTAARSGEVLGAQRQEFDLDAAVWTVPAERMKAGVQHRVPLSPAALQIVKDMGVAELNDAAFVFPGGNPGCPLSAKALHKTLRRMGIEDATPHGFRSAFRDWAAEKTSAASEVCEAALAHTVENKVEAAYRRTDLFDKRRELMTSWARYCGGANADVVPLRAAKRS